jgi:Domain of unknown function (DUF4760)
VALVTAEWVTASATVGTFVVILTSAIAALVQLRHMRGSNQIIALTECRETLESAAFREAERFVSFELPKRLQDPVEAQKVAAIPFVGEYQAIGTVANFFESMGLFVKSGIIDKDIACDFWSFVILRNWNAVAPVIEYVRHKTTPGMWENFEYMAVLVSRYIDRHPTSYPAGWPRMPKDTSLLDAVEKSSR